MTAAELTDEWIGRTVAVHCTGACSTAHVGCIEKYGPRGDQIVILFDNGAGVAVGPETVVTDQEVPL